MIDVLIVGGGVAGCSAAITARMRNLSALVIYAGGGALEKAHRVDNYPGLPEISGPDLLEKLRSHARSMGAQLQHALVQKVMPMGGSFSVLAGNEVYEARTVLLCGGTARVNPLPGEEDLLGAGVSYCATCDGMFYKGKRIAVVAGGEEAVEEANFLADLGDVIYVEERKHATDGLSPAIQHLKDKPVAIKRGEQGLVLVTDQQEHVVDGIFVLRPAVALTQLLPEVATDKGHVVVDQDMMTNVPGVFAAGDMVGNPLQAAKAAGEGTTAAIAIAQYVRKHA
jgi:thioredoxin reductase (NADPH)